MTANCVDGGPDSCDRWSCWLDTIMATITTMMGTLGGHDHWVAMMDPLVQLTIATHPCRIDWGRFIAPSINRLLTPSTGRHNGQQKSNIALINGRA